MKKDPISVTHPELAKQLKDQSLGDVLTHGSSKKVWWVCDLAHEWETAPNRRTSLGTGCPYCGGRKVLAGYNDLGTLRPDIACELKDQSLASQLAVCSDKKVWWVCKDLGHEWESRVKDRTNGSGCPYCGCRKVLAGYNDIGTMRPDVACELKDQSLASQLTVYSSKKVWWVCKHCANEWQAVVFARTRVGSGCPACAKYGFDQTAPAYVYLVAQPALHDEDVVVVKLGISNAGNLETRLAKHARQGLTEVLSTQGYLFGTKALEKETEFKRYLRALPAKYRVTKDELPDGHSEAFLSTAPEWREHVA